MHASKYCADLGPLKSLMDEHIRPIYAPLISMLPDSVQLVLLDETPFAGLSTASCVLLGALLLCLVCVWLSLARHAQRRQVAEARRLNEQLLAMNSKTSGLRFERDAFESCIGELEARVDELTETEARLGEANARAQQELNEAKRRAADQASAHEQRIAALNAELTEWQARLRERDAQLDEYKVWAQQVTEQVAQNEAQRAQLAVLCDEKDEHARALQRYIQQQQQQQSNEMADDEATTSAAFSMSTLAQIDKLHDQVASLCEQLNAANAMTAVKQAECDELMARAAERQIESEAFVSKQREMERKLKEHEIQLKMMAELREKDTKQHLKLMSELDSQLKKKSTEADKGSHLLDQLRVKQERIQELETQFARIEKQANQERQTYEKQVHENWLGSRKLEKELKECKQEASAYKDKLAELEAKTLAFQQQMQQPQQVSCSPSNSFSETHY